MKHLLLKTWLMLAMLLVGVGTGWGETKTGSWDLTSASSDWTASLNETYFSQPYGYKKANGTLTNKSISDFSTTGITQIKVGFKCLQNGGTTSKLTIYLVDKDGKTLGNGVVVTPDNKSAASQTTYKYATFTTNLTGATGFMMKVTTFGKNILINGAEYEVTYTAGGGSSDPVDASWAVEPTSVSVKAGKAATATITTNYDGTLSVSPANSSIATASINGKVITVNGVAEGNTTLTVTGAATSAYNAINKTIDVTVTANNRPANEIFYESFDTNNGTGGNDDQWSGNIATSNIASDNQNWTFEKGNGANECAKFGTGSALGYAQTPALGVSGNATLTFNAAAWNANNENTTLKISLNYGDVTPSSVTLKKGEWTNYTVELTGLNEYSKVKFEGHATSNSRFFLDEVSIVKTDDTPEKTTPTLSFSPSTYNYTMGETFTAPALTNPENVPVTYSATDVTPTNCIEVAENGTVTIHAVGSAIITASYDGSESDTYKSNSASYTLNVSAPKHTVTIDTPTNGTIDVKDDETIISNGTQVAEGTTITLTATPSTGYRFVSWSVTDANGAVTVTDNQFTMPTSNVTISAIFEAIPTYTLTATLPVGGSYTIKVGDAESVSVDEDHNTFPVYEGVTVTMTSTPVDGYKVMDTPFEAKDADENKVSISKNGSNYSFTMPAKAVSVTARFAQTHNISIAESTGGRITRLTDVRGTEITANSLKSRVNVYYEEDEHYTLSRIYYVKAGESNENEIDKLDQENEFYSFDMVDTDITLYAEFDEDTKYTITWSINGNTNRTDDFYENASVVFPNDIADIAGYKFVGWIEAEAYQHATNAPTYVTEATATADKTYYAVFAEVAGDAVTKYVKVTAVDQLTNKNKIVLIHNSTKNVLTHENNAIAAVTATNAGITVTNSEIDIPNEKYIWNLSGDSENGYQLSDGTGYAGLVNLPATDRTGNNEDLALTNSNIDWEIGEHTNPSGAFYLQNLGDISGKAIVLGCQSTKFNVFTSNGPNSSSSSSFILYVPNGGVSYSNFCTDIKHDLNVTSVGYATLCLPYNAVIPSTAMVYTGEYNNGSVTLNQVDDYVCAGEGYIVANAGDHTFRATSKSVDKPQNNNLVGVTVATALTGDGTEYIFSNKDDVLGFHKSKAGTIGANKAYLKVLVGGDGRSFIGFGEDGETAISTIDAMPQTDGKYLMNNKIVIIKNGVKYNVNGQRMR